MTGLTRVLKKLWQGWLRFAHVVGTIQMVIILTLIYWIMLSVMAIPYRLFADSLGHKGQRRKGWTRREPIADRWTTMQSQG